MVTFILYGGRKVDGEYPSTKVEFPELESIDPRSHVFSSVLTDVTEELVDARLENPDKFYLPMRHFPNHKKGVFIFLVRHDAFEHLMKDALFRKLVEGRIEHRYHVKAAA